MSAPQAPIDLPANDLCNIDTPLTRWMNRHRLGYFIFILIILIIPFNGQWRIGLDSSLYRGVAENLAAGNGYTFAGLPQTQVYPGLPYLLAGFQKVLGTNAVWPVLILFNICAALTLFVTYRLISTRYPAWVALAVVTGVGLNQKFVQQSHEVMTDLPFLLGCVTTMLGWEYLAPDQPATRRRKGLFLLLMGLAIAATMRPTFWVLAGALVLTCLWNIIRKRERRSMIALGILVLVGIMFAAIDPRVRGFNIFKGGYEYQFLTLLGDARTRITENVPKLFGREFNESFFNEPLTAVAWPFSLLVFAGAFFVTRRQPFWGLQVLLLTLVMLLLSDEARYYLMVIPSLYLGYILVILWISQRMPQLGRDGFILLGLSFANFLNLAGIVALTYKQHQSNFYAHYRNGAFLRYIEMAKVLHEQVPEDAVIIGPNANVLAYLSGRQVRSGRVMGFDVNKPGSYPRLVAKQHPTYIVGPHTEFGDKDRWIRDLILAGVIKPTKYLLKYDDPEGTLWLAKMDVVLPPENVNWRSLPTTRPVIPSDIATRHGFTPAQMRNREIRAARARKELRAKRERKAIRAERERRRKAATQPATKSATQPASHLQIHLEDLGSLWPFEFPTAS